MDSTLDSEFSLEDSKKAYQEFLSFCSHALDKEDLKILKILQSKYEACSEDFRSSEKMVILLKSTQKHIENEPSRMFVHLKDMVTELKAHSVKRLKKQQKRQFSDDSDSETQMHKAPKLSPCKVVVTKLEETRIDSVSEVASPEKSKVCNISTGILNSVQEIKVASEEQQVSLFKELGCFQNNMSVKSPYRYNTPLAIHNGDKRELLVSMEKWSDSPGSTMSPKSEGQSSTTMLSPLKNNPQQRKSTIIFNTSFSHSPEIQKISVSPCQIARPSTSKDIFDGLAMDMTTTISENQDVTSLDENSEEIPCLKNKPSHSSDYQQNIFHVTVSSNDKKFRKNINSGTVSNRLTNNSNCAKKLFLHKPFVKVDKKNYDMIDSSLSDTEKCSTVLKDDIHSSDSLCISTASTSELDFSQNKECKKYLSVNLNDPQIQEKLLLKDATVVLTNCHLQSPSKENSVINSKEPKRALFTTLTDGNIVASERFSSSIDNKTRDYKLKTVLSGVEGCTSSDEFQGSTKTDDKQLSKHERHVRKLEALLESLRNEIEKCQNQELSLDNMDDETSAYIYEDKLKKKFVAVWNKLCEITKRSVSTGRPTERTIKYSGTRYEEINRRLERFLNKKKLFPDFTDIKNIIKLTNKKYKLNLSSANMDSIAREAFVDIGEMLQTRRHQDFIATFGNRQTDCIRNSGDDPYMIDPELRRKLDTNRKIAKSKLDDVIAKYSKLQDERKNFDDYEDETEDENDASISEERKSNNRHKWDDDDEEEINSSPEDDVINRKSTLSAADSSPTATYNPLGSQLSENVYLNKSDNGTKSHLTSFVRALGLSPLGKTRTKEVSPPPTLDCSSPAKENVIVIGESPAKSLDNASRQTDLQKDNDRFIWSDSGRSRDSAILLSGPNLKFTARKPSTLLPSGDAFHSVSSQPTRSISYDEIALENEEDQEDQSSDSDRGVSDEEEDDDIMIINSSASESDTDSSRGASPVSVILLSSSDDESENTSDSDLRFSDIKEELPSERAEDHMNRLPQHCKPDIKNSISDILDLASNALSESIKGTHSGLKLSILSTEFLDLATGKTTGRNPLVCSLKSSSKILSPKPLIAESQPESGSVTATCKKENRTFSPISFLRDDSNTAVDDSNAAVDKFEVTIEVDDECYESSLPIAAENDSYINHQNIAKSKTRAHSTPESVDLIDVDTSSVVSVIDIDELSKGDKNNVQISSACPAAESSVIVIDEASQDVSNIKFMSVDSEAHKKTLEKEKRDSSCNAVSDPQCSSKMDSEELLETTLLKDRSDEKCIISGIEVCLGSDSQQSADVTVVEDSPQSDIQQTADVTVVEDSPQSDIKQTADVTVVECPQSDIQQTADVTVVECPQNDSQQTADVTVVECPRSDSQQSADVTVVEDSPRSDIQQTADVTVVEDCPLSDIQQSANVTVIEDCLGSDSQQTADVTVVEVPHLNQSQSHDKLQTAVDKAGVTDIHLDLPIASSGIVSDEVNSTQLKEQHSVEINKSTAAELNSSSQGECSSELTGTGLNLSDDITDQLIPPHCDSKVMGENCNKTIDLEEVSLLSMDSSDITTSSSQEDSIPTVNVPCETEDLNKAEDPSHKEAEIIKEVNTDETEIINKDEDIPLADNTQKSETTNKPSTDSSIADYEEDDDFKSIFRICGEIIQNTEQTTTVTEKASEEGAGHPVSSNSEMAQSDKPAESALLTSPENGATIKDNIEMQQTNKDDSVTGSTSPAQKTDASPTEDGDTNLQTSTMVDDKSTDSSEEEKNTSKEQQQVASCEDEVEIIEELSNAIGQRQCTRTKEEDREWIAQQLNKLTSCSSDELSKSSEPQSLESSSTPADNNEQHSASELKSSEEILDLDMEVECIENGPESSRLNDPASKSDADVIITSSDVCERKRKREILETEKNNPSELASSSSALNSKDLEKTSKTSKETMEPPAKKKLVDPNFITQLISTVYNEFPPGIMAKKPVQPLTNEEDEDVLVVEAHFKPRSVISKPNQPRFPNPNKNIHQQGRFALSPSASLHRNKPGNMSPGSSHGFHPSSSRSQSGTVSNVTSTLPFQRAAYNSQLSSDSRQRGIVKPALPSLSPRVPIPNIQTPFANESTRNFSKPILPHSQRRPGPYSNTFPAFRSASNDKKGFNPYVKNFQPSPPSFHNNIRQNSVFHRNQRGQMNMAPRFTVTNQRARYPQPVFTRSTKPPARKLDGAEIVLDDSDTEDSTQSNHSSSTPVILSVTSLSKESAADKTKTLKKSNSKNSGDTIVLSDSD